MADDFFVKFLVLQKVINTGLIYSIPSTVTGLLHFIPVNLQ